VAATAYFGALSELPTLSATEKAKSLKKDEDKVVTFHANNFLERMKPFKEGKRKTLLEQVLAKARASFAAIGSAYGTPCKIGD